MWNLADQNLDLSNFAVEHDGERYTYVDMVRSTYTDACDVVHNGAIVFEYYDEGIRPTDTHLLMSVSKSLTASLIGVLVAEGTLATDGLGHAWSVRRLRPRWAERADRSREEHRRGQALQFGRSE